MSFKEYVKWTAALLRARTPIGGLEVSDAALRFALFEDGKPKLLSLRLPPGLMESNQIKNRAEFVGIAKKLREQILGAEASRNKKVSVVVSLSSISIYSQVFGLPIIRGENLEKAVQLNIQMVSPVEVKEAYSGWQLVGEDKDTFRLEVLSAFIDRKVVDEVTNALEEAGFTPVAIESRALALARLMRERGLQVNVSKPYILVNLDSSGLDLLILRKGQLYFEYFHGWKDIQNEKQQVTREAFEALLKRSFYQVLNFYSAHWPEPVRDAFVSAVSLGEEVSRVISRDFGLSVQPLSLKGDFRISSEWFVSLGSALRGLVPRTEDRDISLLGVGAQERFRHEQLLGFVSFWRIIVPVVLGILLITFITADVFLINLRRSLESQSAFQLKRGEVAEMESLRARAARFNRTVDLIQAVEKLRQPKGPLIEKLATLLKAHNIEMSRFYYQDSNTPSLVSGEASSEEDILDFKKALDLDPSIKGTQLPLTEIKKSAGKGFSFSLSFIAKL